MTSEGVRMGLVLLGVVGVAVAVGMGLAAGSWLRRKREALGLLTLRQWWVEVEAGGELHVLALTWCLLGGVVSLAGGVAWAKGAGLPALLAAALGMGLVAAGEWLAALGKKLRTVESGGAVEGFCGLKSAAVVQGAESAVRLHPLPPCVVEVPALTDARLEELERLAAHAARFDGGWELETALTSPHLAGSPTLNQPLEARYTGNVVSLGPWSAFLEVCGRVEAMPHRVRHLLAFQPRAALELVREVRRLRAEVSALRAATKGGAA